MKTDKIIIEPGLEFDAANVQHPMARQAGAGSAEHLESGSLYLTAPVSGGYELAKSATLLS